MGGSWGTPLPSFLPDDWGSSLLRHSGMCVSVCVWLLARSFRACSADGSGWQA